MKRNTNLISFISYAKKDIMYLNTINERSLNFNTFQHENVKYSISFWWDDKISTGENWKQEIFSTIQESTIVICLISKNFLDSKYIMEVEVPKAIERFELSRIRIVGILLEDCEFSKTNLKHIELIPKNRGRLKPVNQWKNQKECWEIIRREVRECAKKSIDGIPEFLREKPIHINQPTRKKYDKKFASLQKKGKRKSKTKKGGKGQTHSKSLKSISKNILYIIGGLLLVVILSVITSIITTYYYLNYIQT